MGTNCAPLLSDLFLFSYEADLIQGLLQKNEKKLARSLNKPNTVKPANKVHSQEP
jgi:hypothetical protein